MSLEIRNVVKSYVSGGTRVLDGVSLSFASNKFYGLLGPSGCGKTTLLRILAGLEEADSGSLEVNGETWLDSAKGVKIAAEKRNVGMVFQNYAVWPHMSVFENVAFPLRIRKLANADIKQRVDSVLERVRLNGLELRKPAELSGGQQQRVALARALVQQPKLLLLDEPLSNLDAHLREELRQEIRRLQVESQLPALIVTHDWHDARTLCDDVAILRNGKVEQQGSPAAIFEKPGSDFVARLVGAR
jgi:ABC-type Fe3+/spermidine/putrescine transport system ATPase subunit